MSFLWPSKYAKIRFRSGLRDPAGELTTLPQTPSRLKRGHPSPYHTPALGTNPPSAILMRPPQNTSQI